MLLEHKADIELTVGIVLMWNRNDYAKDLRNYCRLDRLGLKW